MNKQDFLAVLRARLSGLPERDVEERLAFYSEMIDDRIEEGLSEADAVSAIGSVDAIVAQILADIPFAKEKTKPKKQLKAWAIVLLVLGSPIWLSLAVAAFVVLLSLYVVLWSVIVTVWAVFVSLIACALGGAVACVVFVCQGNGLTGLAMIGAGFVCAGLSIFLFFGCLAATRWASRLTDKVASGIRSGFAKKEAA